MEYYLIQLKTITYDIDEIIGNIDFKLDLFTKIISNELSRNAVNYSIINKI
jgi:hypothetical protein